MYFITGLSSVSTMAARSCWVARKRSFLLLCIVFKYKVVSRK